MDAINPMCLRLRPLAEYATRLPSSRRGKRLNRATLWRWALSGVRGGRLLCTAVLGAGRMTCDAWVWQFLAQSGGASRSAGQAPRFDPLEREQIARELHVRGRRVEKTHGNGD
jgi:hypothetical protein